jgi:hypothetical protein
VAHSVLCVLLPIEWEYRVQSYYYVRFDKISILSVEKDQGPRTKDQGPRTKDHCFSLVLGACYGAKEPPNESLNFEQNVANATDNRCVGVRVYRTHDVIFVAVYPGKTPGATGMTWSWSAVPTKSTRL